MSKDKYTKENASLETLLDLAKQNKSIKPVVKATDFKVEFGIDSTVF